MIDGTLCIPTPPSFSFLSKSRHSFSFTLLLCSYHLPHYIPIKFTPNRPVMSTQDEGGQVVSVRGVLRTHVPMQGQ